jgi:PAS domain S-box-containing protein
MADADLLTGPTGTAPVPGAVDEASLSAMARGSAAVGFWSWNIETDTLWFSSELYRIHGVVPGSLGERLEDYLAFVHPEDRLRTSEAAMSAATGQTLSLEYRFVHPEGGVRHLFGRAAVVGDRSGNAQRVVGTIQDIGDIRRARRYVADAVTRLSSYFEEMPVPSYLWRREGDELVLRRFNKAAIARWGERADELAGSPAGEFLADRPDIIADIKECMERQVAITREVDYTSKGLGTRRLVITYVPVGPDSVVAHTEDISELLSIAGREQRATEQLAEYFQRIPTPAYLWRMRDGAIVFEAANTAGVEVTGGRVKDIVGARAEDVYADAPEVVADLARAFAGETFTREFRYRLRLTEDERDLVVTYVHIPPDAVAAHTLDVTEQRTMEAELRESHEAARVVLDASTEPIVLIEPDGTMLALNDAAAASVRVPKEQLLGQRMYDFFPPKVVEGRRAAVARVLRERGPAHVEDEAEGRYFRATMYPLFDESGDVSRVVIYAQDVTEERQAQQAVRDREAEMTAVIERNPDGICLIVGGRISVCNSALAALVGCSSEKIVGHRLHDLMSPEDRERAKERGRILLEGGPSQPGEYDLLRCDGSRVSVEIYSAAFDFRGEPALICTLRDVGMRKRAERELAESRDALRALTQHLESVREEERVQVSRDLHDELGSVLTALKIDMGEALEGDEERTRGLLTEMSGLVQQAIEVGRRVTARLRPGILDDLGLAAAAEWLGTDLERRTGVRCEVVLPEEEPELPEPIATTMFRILQEALTNVIRHADADRVEVVLESDDASVALTVMDNGQGFDPGVPGGAGFGLLGMRERVRSFGGVLDVRSAPGDGTTIRVALPLVAPRVMT